MQVRWIWFIKLMIWEEENIFITKTKSVKSIINSVSVLPVIQKNTWKHLR